jgi:hypothetical protein
MKTQQCADCEFFEPTNYYKHGYCHRHAPVRREWAKHHDGRTDNGEPTSAWPGVKSSDWCGEFQDRKS